MELVRTSIKVILQDAAIVGSYWVVACGIDKFASALPISLLLALLFVVWVALLFLLFFSHAELFRWVRNDYAWSMTTGFTALVIMIPVVMGGVHNSCPLVGAT